MTAAEDSVEASLPHRLPKNLQVGLASVDPRTGAVRALYGGPDFLERQQNAATQDSVEAAGTFSPFIVVTALKAGFPLDAEMAGPAEVRIDGETIDNFRGRNYGTISLSQAAAGPRTPHWPRWSPRWARLGSGKISTPPVSHRARASAAR